MLERAHRHLAAALALGAASLLGACAGDGAEENLDTAALGTSAGALDTAGGAAGAGAMSEANIFGLTALVDQAEVEAGELAREKAQNARVKEYAARMVTEHSNHMREAGNLAQQLSVNPSEPTGEGLEQMHDELMTNLRQASGVAFDTLYMAGMVREHSATLERLNAAMNATQNQQVQQFLNRTRTTVQQHLELAQQIRGELAGGAGR